MKRFIAVLFGLLLIGAGCSSATVEGDWYLAFDLPNDWVMTDPYVEGDRGEDLDISRELTEVYLQSRAGHMLFSDRELSDLEVDKINVEVLRDEMTRISVTRLDERRIIPSEAEDLGKGWYRLAPCAEAAPEDACEDSGEEMTYYYETEDGEKYLFRVEYRGQELSEAEEVIFSAEVVTTVE